jgi:coenzyme F420-0:L-glutamate ligase/coenzyme F420-1:gamma-L-glutamate ligase
VNVAIGVHGLPAIIDLVGTKDAYGRELRTSQQAVADEIVAGSGLLMLKDVAPPVVVVRGFAWTPNTGASAREYVRPIDEDLFR